MCGIFASLTAGTTDASQPEMLRALNAMAHRGPDARSALGWTSTKSVPQEVDLSGSDGERGYTLLLSHLRLSIIDTSEAGTQPVISEDGRFALTYNGELYNYIELREELRALGWEFTTETDTEVLLKSWQQWGRDCLNKFLGMFAFVLFDRDAQRLYAVRDFFGIKPLYFSRRGSNWLFCSDFTALRAITPSVPDSPVNLREAAFYIRFGVTQFSDQTLVNGIERVGVAEIVEIDVETGSVLARDKYFDVYEIEPQDWSFEEAAQQLREAFLRSVELHMRADVPYAATLSGGIDSSAIVCAMKELSDQPIHTFSFHAKTEKISETKWINLVNEHVGAISHPIKLDDSALTGDLSDLLSKQGEPFGSLSIYASYKVQQEIARSGFKVVLSGQGADEILGGYTHFFGDYAADFISRGDFIGLRRWLAAVRQNVDGVSSKQVLASSAERMLPARVIATLRNLDRRPLFNPWVNQQRLGQFGMEMAANKRRERRPSYLKSALKHHLARGPMADLLRYEDRNAMAHSIENRVPFLTPDLVRLTLSFPDEFLISRQGITKCVFRAAMRGIVPDEILDRRDKIGFAPDNKHWLQDPRIYQGKTSASISQELIDWDAFNSARERLDLTSGNAGDAVWRAVNFRETVDASGATN